MVRTLSTISGSASASHGSLAFCLTVSSSAFKFDTCVGVSIESDGDSKVQQTCQSHAHSRQRCHQAPDYAVQRTITSFWAFCAAARALSASAADVSCCDMHCSKSPCAFFASRFADFTSRSDFLLAAFICRSKSQPRGSARWLRACCLSPKGVGRKHHRQVLKKESTSTSTRTRTTTTTTTTTITTTTASSTLSCCTNLRNEELVLGFRRHFRFFSSLRNGGVFAQHHVEGVVGSQEKGAAKHQGRHH